MGTYIPLIVMCSKCRLLNYFLMRIETFLPIFIQTLYLKKTKYQKPLTFGSISDWNDESRQITGNKSVSNVLIYLHVLDIFVPYPLLVSRFWASVIPGVFFVGTGVMALKFIVCHSTLQ